MCMRFACNPQINFITFSHSFDLVIFAKRLPKNISIGYLVDVTPPCCNFTQIFLNFAGGFLKSENVH